MAVQSAEQVAQRAFNLDLIDERQLREVWGELGRRNVSADVFLQHLVRRGMVTNFQVERMMRGERGGFFYGDYKVLYMVAAGTFARVYRAVHKDTGKIVALKVLRKRYSDDSDQTDLFYREGQMGKGLSHTNIVPIYEVYSRGSIHFLVMEFIEGNNLREFLRLRKKLTPEEATKLMTDITEGLRYASEHGITHRDVKLTNILVSSRGQAKLVDFGLAAEDTWSSDEALAANAGPRVIDYAGLERYTRTRKNDPRSDIYFLGCIYYHMLTGNPALRETKDRVQRLSKSRFLEVKPIHTIESDLPRTVVQVVNKAMQLDPNRRYQTPAELVVDLKLAATRLDEPHDNVDVEQQSDEAVALAERERLAALLIPVAQRTSVMYIESNIQMQDLIREALKKSGYRVLVFGDPERAMARFEDDDEVAECVIFSTGELGRPALDAFNRFAQHESTKNIPAVLLLGAGHDVLEEHAELAPHRVVLKMPMKLKKLREKLAELAPPASATKS